MKGRKKWEIAWQYKCSSRPNLPLNKRFFFSFKEPLTLFSCIAPWGMCKRQSSGWTTCLRCILKLMCLQLIHKEEEKKKTWQVILPTEKTSREYSLHHHLHPTPGRNEGFISAEKGGASIHLFQYAVNRRVSKQPKGRVEIGMKTWRIAPWKPLSF